MWGAAQRSFYAEVCAKFMNSSLLFAGWLSCPVGRWTMVAPPAPQVPPTHRLISISQPTFEQTKSSTGRAAPRPSAPDFSFFRRVILPFCSAQDECGRGGKLFSVRSAAEHILHRIHGSLGRPVSGPGGQSPESPGAGPNAAGWEEVLLTAQTGRLAGRIPRWASVSHQYLTFNEPPSVLVNNACMTSFTHVHADCLNEN